MTTVQNFIDGKLVDSVSGATMPLVEAEGRNTGKPNHVTMAEEIPPMVDQIRFFAGAARILEGKSAGDYMAGHTSWIRREPVGVIGQVTPWNYPMMMAIWKFAPAIAAGNTVVVKPSDTTPVTTVMLAELAAKHLPPGVLNVVTGDRVTGAALVAHPTPQMVSITGSVAAGRAVATSAGGHLKRTHLELGGKAPVIVFGDADIAAAAEAIATAGYFNAGQDCTAATRVIGHASVATDLTDALAEQARSAATTFGRAADDEDAWVPPVNNANQLQRVLGYLAEVPDHLDGHGGRPPAGRQRLLHRAHRHRRAAPRRRTEPERDLRPGDHGAELRRRRRRGSAGQRRRVRAGVVGVDEGRVGGAAGVRGAGLRLRVDQHPHPAGRGDAARRFQVLGTRQRPIYVRVRGLHPHQARDGADLLSDFGAVTCADG